MQEPTGQPTQVGGVPPTTLTGRDLLIQEALQPVMVQDPGPQGPPPRLPQMNVPEIGPDSPPVLGLIQGPNRPPPQGTVWPDLPPTLQGMPPHAQEALLKSIPKMLLTMRQQQDYERDLMLQRGTEMAPEHAAQLESGLVMEPEKDWGPAIDEVAPFLPKSRAQQLRDRQKRIKEGKDISAEAEKRFEAKLKEQFAPYLRDKDKERDWSAQHEAKVRATSFQDLVKEGWSQGTAGARSYDRGDEGPYADGKSTALRDIGRGAGSIVTNNATVGDSMLAALDAESERMVNEHQPSELDLNVARFLPPELARGMERTPTAGRKLPPGWDENTLRATLADARQRVVARLKRDTTKEDMLGETAGVVAQMPIGIGEVAAGAKAAEIAGNVIGKLAPALVKSSRINAAVGGFTRYIGVPGAAEFGRGVAQPLRGEDQARVDSIQDPHTRAVTEDAYRILSGTQNATLQMLFSLSDTFRFYGKTAGRVASKIESLAPPSMGKRVLETLGIGLLAPAASDVTNQAIGKGAEALSSGEVSKADVLKDLYASKGMTGPATRLLQAIQKGEGVWDAAKEYAKATVPMMAGIGSIHVLDAIGGQFPRRAAMLKGLREAEADLRKVTEKGDLDKDVADKALQILREKADELAPTKAEDQRADTKEAIASTIGEGAGEARVLAEEAAKELLPHVPGDTLADKHAHLRNLIDLADDGSPESEAAMRDYRTSLKLTGASKAKDRAEAGLRIAAAREPGRAPDDAALSAQLRREETLQAKPGAADATLRAVADDATAEWHVVHHDPESGAIVLRDADRPDRRITIDEADLPNYRLADEGAAPTPQEFTVKRRGAGLDVGRVPREEWDRLADQSGSMDDDPDPNSLDPAELYAADKEMGRTGQESIAQAVVDQGITTPRGLAKAMGITEPAATKLLEQVHAGDTEAVSQVRGADLARIEAKLHEMREAIATKGPDAVEGMGELIADYGDVSHPGQGEIGSAEIAGKLLASMPEQIRGDDRAVTDLITGPMGFSEDSVPAVKEAMQRAVEPRKGVPESAAFHQPEVASKLDLAAALKAPQVAPFDGKLQAMHREAMGYGLGEQHAADTVFEQWATDNGVKLESHQAFVEKERGRVDEIEADIHSQKPAVRNAGMRDLALRLRELDMQDEPTALLSLTPEGREVLQRLADLRHQVIEKGEIDAAQWFHGAAAPIEKLGEAGVDHYSGANIYGEGFYATNDREVAQSYTKKNRRQVGEFKPTTYEVRGEDVKFFDLNAPLNEEAREALAKTSSESLREAAADPENDTLGKVMDAARDLGPQYMESRDTVTESFEAVKDALKARGYGGFTHVGGKLTGGKQHQVRIYWHPESQVKLRTRADWGPSQSGTLYVPNLKPILINQYRRAVFAMQMMHKGADWFFAHAKAAAGKYLVGPIGKGWSLPKRLFGEEARKQRASRAVEMRAETVRPDNTGEIVGKRGEFWRHITHWMDKLSAYRETDFVMMAEQAGYMARVAHEASTRLEAVFREDSEADLKINSWLEATDEQRPEIEKSFTDGQREILKLVDGMYKGVQKLVARDLLPDQMMRKNHLRVLRQAAELHGARLAEVDATVRSQSAMRDAAANEAGLAGVDKKAHPEWIEADRQLRNAKAQRKRVSERLEKTTEHIARLEAEREQKAAEWGIKRYAPAVPNRDPSETTLEAQQRGLAEPGVRMPDPAKEMDALRKAEAKMTEIARDATYQPMPRYLTAGHWYARAGALEGAGMRDQSGVRSFFHYMRELYRLIPASQWYERNIDRIFGQQRLVTIEEMLAGGIGEHGVKEVEYQDYTSGASVRANQFYRLGGSVYTLSFVNEKGQKKEVAFRTLADRNAARDHAMTGAQLGIGEGWKLAETQLEGQRVMLMPSKQTTSPLMGPAHGNEMPVGEELDAGTKRLVLPKGPTGETEAKFVWPSEMLGKLTVREAGKLQQIRAGKGGKEAAQAFARYIEEGLNTAMGRSVHTRAQRWAAALADVYRHSWMGLLNPFSAVKEVIDTTVSNGLWMGFDRTLAGAALSAQFGLRLRKATMHLQDTAAWLQEHTPRMVDGEIKLAPEQTLKNLRRTDAELENMTPEARKQASIEDDAMQDFVGSFLSGESIMEHFTSLRRDFRYGESLKGSAVKRTKDAAGKLSWFVRHQAQTHSMRQTWFGAYLTEREAGKTRKQAIETADRFAMANGNIGNRLSQGQFFQGALGQLLRPATSWNVAVSSTNWRYFFPGAEVNTATLAKALVSGGTRAVTRIASWMATAWLYQQLGMLVGFDLTRNVGQGMSEVPGIGPDLTYQAHNLQSKVGLVPDPADASAQPSALRRGMKSFAEQFAPEILRDWVVKQSQTIGGTPADVAVPLFWGSWIPGMGKVMNKWIDAATYTYQGDSEKAALAWDQVLPSNWLRRIFHGSRIDPTDSNYVLVTNAATGVTNKRMKRNDYLGIIASLAGSSIDDSVDRVRSMLGVVRDRQAGIASRNASFDLETRLRDARDMTEQARRANTAEGAHVLEETAKQQSTKVRDDAVAYAKERGMTPPEARAYVGRIRKMAEQNYSLTSAERDIIHARDTETAFKLMTHALNSVNQPMTQKRWELIRSIWYDPQSYPKAVRGLTKETRDNFLRAYEVAKERWKADAPSGTIPR